MSLEPLIVHPLPPARAFAGRERELAEMQDFWASGDGVLSIVGIGGAGKTALAERFLRHILENDQPDGLLVWSFYDDPDANFYLKTAYSYVTGGSQMEAKGTGWFHLLRSVIGDGRRLLFVLDGLERVQRPHTDASGVFGEIEDPLLKGLLVRIASGAGNAKAIVTSRFPLASVESYAGKGFRVTHVDLLPEQAARALFAQRGIELGPDEAWVFRDYGSHALTLDLLAGFVAGYRDGDVSKLPRVPPALEKGNETERRLSIVLELIRDGLEERQRDLLSRLCVFRFGVKVEQLKSIFVGEGKDTVGGALASVSDAELEEDLGLLQRMHIVHAELDQRFTIHPAIRDHFYRLFRDATVVHRAVQEHLNSLAARPGIGFPEDKESLDLLEELIHHAISSNALDEAYEVYMHRMGGSDHLNNRLGDYARTYRILCSFEECPDRTGMYHCLRAFGRFEEALKWRPKNRYIMLLSGHLDALRDDESTVTRSFARHLRGEETLLPDRSPDVPITASMLHLYAGNYLEAKRVAHQEIQASLYEDDKVRNRLAIAEALRCEGRHQDSEKIFEEASDWVLNSSSAEHMVYMQLFKGRLHRDQGHTIQAKSAIAEGLSISREASFKVPLTHLLIEMAHLEPDSAKPLLDEAVALAESISFSWGARDARKARVKLGV